MEEHLSEDEQKRKKCKEVFIITIIMDLCLLTGIWIIVWLVRGLFIPSYKKDLDEKCYKKLQILWVSPLVLWLLLFWWCIFILSLPY